MLLKEMGGLGVRRDTISYHTALSACEKAGQWDVALDILGQMGETPKDKITYSAAISACKRGEQWALPSRLLGQTWDISFPSCVFLGTRLFASQASLVCPPA